MPCASSSQNTTLKAKRVVIIEDDIDYAGQLEQTYRAAGWRSTLINDPDEHIVERIIEETPDLVHTDFNLPGINGLSIIERLRSDSRTASIPIVMVTSLDDSMTARSAIDRGATKCLAKGRYAVSKIVELAAGCVDLSNPA